MRKRALFLLAVPLAGLSGLAGHASAYAVVGLNLEDTRAHGYLSDAPLFVAACSALLIVALALRIGGRLRGRPSAWPFALLPLIAFATQEVLERIVAGLPASAVLEPAVYLGLAAQIPIAFVAFFVARGLLRVADEIVAAFAPAASVSLRPPSLIFVPAGATGPSRRPLCFDRLGRAPPLS